MAKKIIRPPFHKIEKIYRSLISILFYITILVLFSALIIVPIFATETSYLIMICYSIYFYIFVLGIAASCILSFLSARKAKDENLYVQSVVNLISTILLGANWKFFTVIFLFGIKSDKLAEKLIGSNTDAFVIKAQKQWISLIIAVIMIGVIAVISTFKLSRERELANK
ncbi:MAG: hypothetical protein GX896_02235 [Clostridiales bacterium]|nr:hypothetical protein [Clostridiales bacterium]